MSKPRPHRASTHGKASQKRSSAPPPGASPSAGASLAVRQPSQRIAALLHEHRQLLSKIKQKKAERQRLAERIESAMSVGQRDGLPLLAEIMEIDRQVHALFAELLARAKEPRKTQKIVRSVYSSLQNVGVLSPAWVHEDEQSAPDLDEQPSERRPSAEAQPAPDDKIPPWATGGETAKRGPDRVGGSSLRGLFHRLADALHPDKVQDEQDKAERTEAMKELTQAYQAGDLARLIELERAWLLPSDRAPEVVQGAESDDLDRRCAGLEATNRALRAQLEGEKRALRDLRRSPQAEFLADLKHMTTARNQDPVESWLDALRIQRAGLSELKEFVCAYRDGKIDVQEFQRGPLSDADDGDDEQEDLDLDDLIAALDAASQVGKPRRRSRRSSVALDLMDDLF